MEIADFGIAMPKVYENKKFECIYDRDSGRIFSHLQFRNCKFESCRLSITSNPRLRAVVRHVQLVNCSQQGCALECAIVEDVVLDGLESKGQLFQTWGAVFNRVILRGKLDRIMISPFIGAGLASAEVQSAFDTANFEYYKNVSWALDISEAEFKELDIRGLPSRLVRRDPETQIVVTRHKAEQGAWRELPLEKINFWNVTFDLLLKSKDPDVILMAPKRHPRFKTYLDDLVLLRKEGIAEPD
jgi:hypothetical protein